jgi:hypothetical protein
MHGSLKLTVWRPSFAGFVNSTSKFISIVIQMLKPVLCYSHDGVPLNFKNKSF